MHYILVVEDDHLQEYLVVGKLRKAFPRARVDSIKTEHQFRAEFDKIVEDPPDVVVMDVMLRWTNPNRDYMPPRDEDVEREGSNRAGFRCVKMLAEHEKTKDIPVILYTVLERNDIIYELPSRDGDIYLLKESNTEPLVRKIHECLSVGSLTSSTIPGP